MERLVHGDAIEGSVGADFCFGEIGCVEPESFSEFIHEFCGCNIGYPRGGGLDIVVVIPDGGCFRFAFSCVGIIVVLVVVPVSVMLLQ